MKHRDDVDGLRAFAIIPVLLFHAGFEQFSGGFIGVDVFFVISGFLISRIVFDDIAAGNFSLAGFYERRIRRIFPALFVTLAATTAAVSIIYLPRDLADYGGSLISAALSVSNFFFLSTVSYFDADAATKPLLHTWSLSVEEQFYVFFPVFLLAVWRFARRFVAHALWVVWAISLAASIYGAIEAPRFTFFMLPTRTWELLTGALVALNFVPVVRNGRLREAISLAGLAAIVACVFIYTEDLPFPGAAALVPVIGTALVLWCGQGTAAARLLSVRALVFVGLISYSLYLVHWPIIAIYEYRLGARLGGWTSVLVVLISVLLAYASWKWVERPFRNRAFLSRRTVLATGFGAMAAASLVGAVGPATGGLPMRFSPEVVAIANAEADVSPRRADCHSDSRAIAPEKSCIFGEAANPAIDVWGDSHGVELAYALGEVANPRGVGVVEMTMSACPPVLNFVPLGRAKCPDRNLRVLDYIAATPALSTVVLVARYDVDAYQDKPALIAGIMDTAHRLSGLGRKVVILSALPYAGGQVPRMAAFAALAGGPTPMVNASFADWVDEAFREFPKQDDITIVEPSSFLCTQAGCATTQKDGPLFFDDNHLSVKGARLAVANFLDEFF